MLPSLVSRRVAPGISLRQAQRLLRRSLAGLGKVAGDLSCLLVQSELDPEPLRSLAFQSVEVVGQGGARGGSGGTRAGAALIVTVGTDVAAAQQAVSEVDERVSAAIVVVIVPFLGCGTLCGSAEGDSGSCEPGEGADASDPGAAVEVGRSLKEARASLFQAGATDVVCLFAGETLKPYRVMEIVERSDNLAARMADVIQTHVASAKAEVVVKYQVPPEKLLLQVAGRAMKDTPREDGSLQEAVDKGGCLVGVGGYMFSAVLGSGSFGRVFRATAPNGRPCAVKVFTKKQLTNLQQLMTLDAEFGTMIHLPEHPNVVKAQLVLHARHNFYLVMDYAGAQSLHRYTKAVLKRTGAKSLTGDVVESFRRQQAAALSHLHCSMVCHRDVKPENWVVGDGGQTVRLTDFSLATHVMSSDHRLKQACGSLPFVAPEVYVPKGAAAIGYDGFAADIWSLAVNYVELTFGPYSVEALLGWKHGSPDGDDEQLCCLEHLPDLWGGVAHEDASGSGHVISKMLVLDPAARWKIGQVVGTQGLALEHQARPPRTGKQARRPAHSKSRAPPDGGAELIEAHF